MSNFSQFLSASLAAIEKAGLKRTLRRLESPQGAEVRCGGEPILNFSSNDYLGLADHPKLREAAEAALEDSGLGAGASRLICGNHRHHEELEIALSHFKSTEAALSFSTGYAAALGTIPALVGEKDVIILDKLSHASLVDAARLSGAILRVFPHNNLEKLESHLRWARTKHPQANILVVAESIYSMDGDRAPLVGMVELKERYGAWLFLDEAHGVGVVGENGRGLADAEGVSARVEVQMGTLGKALGSSGAYICGTGMLRDFLINRARSFIFSTAPLPAAAAGAKAAVDLLGGPEGAVLVETLWRNLHAFSDALDLPPPASAIFPLILGDERKAVETSENLREAGFWVPAIRFPTVAKGAARLRVVVTAGHTLDQIDELASALESIKAST